MDVLERVCAVLRVDVGDVCSSCKVDEKLCVMGDA